MTSDLALSRAQAREVDRLAVEEYGVPGVVLMENAGLLATLELLERCGPFTSEVAVLCGGGNNGGDGYVVARQLALRGVAVQVFATHPTGRLTGDARVMRAILDAAGPAVLPLESDEDVALAEPRWARASLIVDALLGTGFAGVPRPDLARVLESLERARARSAVPVAALDLPSGFDADSGEVAGACLRADLTLTFVAPKRGFGADGAERWTGEVVSLPIGAPAVALERARASVP